MIPICRVSLCDAPCASFRQLWAVVLGSIFLLGPAFTTLCWSDYFSESGTWRYLTTALLVPQNGLPGVFSDNPRPLSVNASLWTLPVEFLCYLSVALLGVVKFASKGVLITASLLFAVLIASFPPPIAGGRYVPNFEMIAVFWSGVFYGHCIRRPLDATPLRIVFLVLAVIALSALSVLGQRGIERMMTLLCAVLFVHLALKVSVGSKLTDPLGDLSYGIYIFAFPVQQTVMHWCQGGSWAFGFFLSLSLTVTFTAVLAFASWHLIEKPVLRLKPGLPTVVS